MLWRGRRNSKSNLVRAAARMDKDMLFLSIVRADLWIDFLPAFGVLGTQLFPYQRSINN